MYGLPLNTDVGFLIGAHLIQVCIGENDVVLNLHPDASVMIAGSIRVDSSEHETTKTLEKSADIGLTLVPMLGDEILEARVLPEGTLRLTLSSGSALELLDSWDQFESYTIKSGARVIVV
jgi:hypothetical protein